MTGTVVCICSIGHSGSTMLDLMLGNGRDAFSCGEIAAGFRPYRQHHFKIDCACGRNPCPVWQQFQEAPQSKFHATVVQKTQADFVIDSSKSLFWVLDVHRWARKQKLNIYDVLLWKHPIDLCSSWSRRGRSPLHWRQRFITYYTRALKCGIGTRALKLADLVSDPEKVLRRICVEIGLRYFPGKHEFWNGQYHHLFGARRTREQVQSERSSVIGTPQYSSAFEAQIPQLTARIEADVQLQHVLRSLEEIDLLGSTTAVDPLHQSTKTAYPLWYYKQRLWQLFKRYFPDKFDVHTRW